jgi:dUTP pyrophosphatase
MEVRVRLLRPGARLPRYAHPGDAGADLFSAEAVELPPGGRRDVSTGMAIAVPEGFAAFVQPRSGLAFNSGITVLNSPGLIDSGYRGEVKVCLLNTGDRSFSVEAGDRIAQLVVQRVEAPLFTEVEALDSTARGTGGFGSTG